MSRLRDLLALSDLKRWNVVPTSRDQTVAQHCFRVAVIGLEIVEQLIEGNTLLGFEVLLWSMIHDGPECLTGDLPSALKDKIDHPPRQGQLKAIEMDLCPWYNPDQVSEKAQSIVKIAEAIESSAWLSQFGLSGTEPLVADLRQKVFSRCDRANLTWPGLGAAGRTVAEQVWRAKFPLKLREERQEHDTIRGTGTDGCDRTNDDGDNKGKYYRSPRSTTKV